MKKKRHCPNFENFLKKCESTKSFVNFKWYAPLLDKSIGQFYDTYISARKNLFNLIGLNFVKLTSKLFYEFQFQLNCLEHTLEYYYEPTSVVSTTCQDILN